MSQADFDPREDAEVADDQPEEHDDTAEIRDDIEDTRAQLSETIDAIQERMNPERLRDEAVESVREATIGRAEQMVTEATDVVRGTGMSIWETIKENPVPAAMAAIGIGWLLKERQNAGDAYPSYLKGRYGGSNFYGEQNGGRFGETHRGSGRISDKRVGGYVSYRGGAQPGSGYDREAGRPGASTGGAAQHDPGADPQAMMGDARERVGQMADDAQERVGEFADQAQEQVQYLQRRAGSTFQQNPLAVGAAALAVGVAAGLILPETEPENRLMGEAREQFMDQAREMAQQAQETAGRVAERVTSELQEGGEPGSGGSTSTGDMSSGRPGAGTGSAPQVNAAGAGQGTTQERTSASGASGSIPAGTAPPQRTSGASDTRNTGP